MAGRSDDLKAESAIMASLEAAYGKISELESPRARRRMYAFVTEKFPAPGVVELADEVLKLCGDFTPNDTEVATILCARASALAQLVGGGE